MELVNIEKLLEKYINAEATLQEEAVLRHYFTKEEVAPHLQYYSQLFEYLKSNEDEHFSKTIQLSPEYKSQNDRKWLSVAVSVFVLFSVFIGYQKYQKEQQRKQYVQIKEVLQLVSVNLKKGNDAIYMVSNNLNKGNEAVSKLYTYENTVNKIIDKVKY